MGLEQAKSLLQVKEGKSFLAIIAEQAWPHPSTRARTHTHTHTHTQTHVLLRSSWASARLSVAEHAEGRKAGRGDLLSSRDHPVAPSGHVIPQDARQRPRDVYELLLDEVRRVPLACLVALGSEVRPVRARRGRDARLVGTAGCAGVLRPARGSAAPTPRPHSLRCPRRLSRVAGRSCRTRWHPSPPC
jgi:hypothetical protein